MIPAGLPLPFSLPLTPPQFAEALCKGLGRAYLHIHSYGDAGLEEVVLHGCTHRLAYDAQCEASRAPWLGEMLGMLPDAGRYEAAVVEYLRRVEPSPYPAGPDAAHAQELAQVFAARGSTAAAEALRICEERLREDHEVEEEEATGAAPSPSSPAEKVTSLGAMMEALESPPQVERDPWRFASLARNASSADAERLFDLLASETRPVQLSRILAVFHRPRRPLPRVTPEVIALARHGDADVREGALRAMRWAQDSRVRDLALELLREQSALVAEELALLERNGTPDDIRLIESRLTKLDDPHDFHHLCSVAVDLLGAPWMTAAGEGIAVWVYEESPCSNCRRGAVIALAEMKALPKWMAEEIRFDGDAEIRKLASNCRTSD